MAAALPLSSTAVAANTAPGTEAAPATPPVTPPGLTSVAADALTEALDQGQISQAEYALERARSLSRLGAVREEFGTVLPADPEAATLILRDLSLRLRYLSGTEREEGEALLARPNQGGPNDGTLEYSTGDVFVDSAHFRVHYVTTTDDKATPLFAAQISAIMEHVYTTEVTNFGWKAPKSDRNATPNGGNGLFDVYLGNVGADGLYGYCTTDAGQFSYEQYSYCVLDNDYAQSEYGNAHPSLDFAAATAAHEFNHAIQFSYDVAEDGWLLEATATWMEDEVYNLINDHYQYLPSSSLGRPRTPADTWTTFANPADPDTGFQYGQFIWMRHLSERFADRSVIRTIWEQASAPAGPNGRYSLQAIDAMLQAKGSNFAASFAEFAAWNAKASRFYAEGAAYELRVRPVTNAAHSITTGTPVIRGVTDLDHLTSRYIRFKPNGVAAAETLQIAVDLGTAPMQKASVVTLDGASTTVQEIPLMNGEGNLSVSNFGSRDEVTLVVTNASNRMANCDRWQPGTYSCGGDPLDDNRAYTYSAVTGPTHVDPIDTFAPRVGRLRVSPNPIRRGGIAHVSFKVNDAARLKFTVLRRGRKVAGARAAVDSAGFYCCFAWQVGKRRPIGRYTVKLKATDAAGNSRTAKTSFRVIR